jgi:hypothetical protein
VITNTYLPHLAQARHATILSNVPARFLFAWTFIERHRHLGFETDIRQFKALLERDPVRLQQWLDRTLSDTIVLVEVHPRSCFAEFTAESMDLKTLQEVLQQQTTFTQAQRWELPQGVTISLWTKGKAGQARTADSTPTERKG